MASVAATRPLETRSERCRACGGEVTAAVLDPTPGVQAHVASDRHQAWRAGIPMHPLERPCPACLMVTIPSDRERCHGCARDRLRVVAA